MKYKKMQASKVVGLATLITRLESSAYAIQILPDDQEWTAEELGLLERARSKALELVREIETVFDVLNGRSNSN